MADDLPENVVELFPGREEQEPTRLQKSLQKWEPETALQRWQKLALTFPSVIRALVSPNWPHEELTPGTLDAHVASVHSHNGLRWSASFLLAVWKPDARWHHAPAWNPVSAMNCWDSKHRKAWQAWCADPKVF